MDEHKKCVNWASFHPSQNLIVTCSDDNEVLTWKYTSTKISLANRYTGHTGPVTSVVFHPLEKYIISTSKDRSFLVFSLTTHNTIKKYGKNNKRFWHLSTILNRNLLSATTDSGVVIFKINKDRKVFSIDQEKILLLNSSKQVEFRAGKYGATYGMTLPYASLKSLCEEGSSFNGISYNTLHHTILVNNTKNIYFKIRLPENTYSGIEPNIIISGTGTMAKFVNNDSYVVYDEIKNQIYLYSIHDKQLALIKVNGDDTLKNIFVFNRDLFLLYDSGICLYNLTSKQIKMNLDLECAKEVILSKNNKYFAIRNKYSISIFDTNLKLISSTEVKTKIKSFAWNEDNILVFSTQSHLLFMLLNAETGIIKTINGTFYVIEVNGNNVLYMDGTDFFSEIEIDLTECYYKKSLYNNDIACIMDTAENSRLVGKKIVADTSEAGFSNVAINFTDDSDLKFNLALKSNNLQVAHDMAVTLDKKELWSKLTSHAIIQGNTELTETCLRRQGDLEKLSFLYLLCGSKSKSKELESYAYAKNDPRCLFQYSIYYDSPMTRINSLNMLGCYGLSYLVAKVNGDCDRMKKILQSANIKEDDIVWPDNKNLTDSLIKKPLKNGFKNWPLKPSTEGANENFITRY